MVSTFQEKKQNGGENAGFSLKILENIKKLWSFEIHTLLIDKYQLHIWNLCKKYVLFAYFYLLILELQKWLYFQ